MDLESATLRFLTFLLAGMICYLLGVAIGRWLKRRGGVRLGLWYQTFCGALAVFVAAELVGFSLPYEEHLGPLVIVLATGVVLSLIQRFVWEGYFERQRRMPIPKFLRDVIGLILFLVVVVLVLSTAYQVRIPGLLATSGIAAVILGLAMQDLLGNILAGFAIHIGRPYQVGDWLIWDTRHGEVMEINWRSTRLRTNDHVYLDVPNSQIAKQTIVNLTYPTRLHAMRLRLGIDYKAPPTEVKEALVRATSTVPWIMREPQPKAFFVAFGEHAVTYEVKFWMEDQGRYNDIVDAIQTNIWYELRRRRIRIPFPVRTLQVERVRETPAEPDLAAARAAIREQPMFACLDDSQLTRLMAGVQLAKFGRGEHVITQGEAGDSMFVLVNGQARVLVSHNSEVTPVAVLRSGDCFGEMSLLTGERRTATVTALADCEVAEIRKRALGEILQQEPDLANRLSELLAKRRMETEGLVADSSQRTALLTREREYTAGFLLKVRQFFEL
jgi:small-conductance mechanosensitive channel